MLLVGIEIYALSSLMWLLTRKDGFAVSALVALMVIMLN